MTKYHKNVILTPCMIKLWEIKNKKFTKKITLYVFHQEAKLHIKLKTYPKQVSSIAKTPNNKFHKKQPHVDKEKLKHFSKQLASDNAVFWIELMVLILIKLVHLKAKVCWLFGLVQLNWFRGEKDLSWLRDSAPFHLKILDI